MIHSSMLSIHQLLRCQEAHLGLGLPIQHNAEYSSIQVGLVHHLIPEYIWNPAVSELNYISFELPMNQRQTKTQKTKNCLCSNLILPAPTSPLLRLRISIPEQRNPVRYFPDFLVNLPSNFKEFSPYPASFQIPASTFFLNPKLRTNKIERSRFVN
jgi:hypothetical protein